MNVGPTIQRRTRNCLLPLLPHDLTTSRSFIPPNHHPQLDTDKSGTLDKGEIMACHKLLRITALQVRKAPCPALVGAGVQKRAHERGHMCQGLSLDLANTRALAVQCRCVPALVSMQCGTLVRRSGIKRPRLGFRYLQIYIYTEKQQGTSSAPRGSRRHPKALGAPRRTHPPPVHRLGVPVRTRRV